MKRPSPLPVRDLEQLSAYLDGDLPAAQAARLESRLKEDPDLLAALEEIRAVVLGLRELPAVPAPRNFTLRPSDVSARRPSGYPVLSLATALATFAFIVVFGLDAWTQGFSFGAQAPLAAAPEGQALEVGPSVAERTSDMSTDATSTPPAESLMAGSAPAVPTVTPTFTPTPEAKGESSDRSPSGLLGTLKIGFGALALALAGASIVVRRKRS